jgi:hypothetical protein
VRLDVSVPLVQAQVRVAVLAGDEDERGDAGRHVPLRLEQQAGAHALALAVGRDGQPGELGGARAGAAVTHPHGGHEPSAVADAERNDVYAARCSVKSSPASATPGRTIGATVTRRDATGGGCRDDVGCARASNHCSKDH